MKYKWAKLYHCRICVTPDQWVASKRPIVNRVNACAKNTPRQFDVKTTWKRRFNVTSTWNTRGVFGGWCQIKVITSLTDLQPKAAGLFSVRMIISWKPGVKGSNTTLSKIILSRQGDTRQDTILLSHLINFANAETINADHSLSAYAKNFQKYFVLSDTRTY